MPPARSVALASRRLRADRRARSASSRSPRCCRCRTRRRAAAVAWSQAVGRTSSRMPLEPDDGVRVRLGHALSCRRVQRVRRRRSRQAAAGECRGSGSPWSRRSRLPSRVLPFDHDVAVDERRAGGRPEAVVGDARRRRSSLRRRRRRATAPCRDRARRRLGSAGSVDRRRRHVDASGRPVMSAARVREQDAQRSPGCRSAAAERRCRVAARSTGAAGGSGRSASAPSRRRSAGRAGGRRCGRCGSSCCRCRVERFVQVGSFGADDSDVADAGCPRSSRQVRGTTSVTAAGGVGCSPPRERHAGT